MSDDLTRAIAEALGCEESSFYGVAVCVAHGPGWPCRKAAQVAAALAPVIEARVREARAGAWDEGYAKGFYRAQTIHNDDPDRERDASEFDDPNPFDEEVRRG